MDTLAAPEHSRTHMLSSASARPKSQAPGEASRLSSEKHPSWKQRSLRLGWGRVLTTYWGAALPLKTVGEGRSGSGSSQVPSSQSPWVAARRVRHMLLFSSLNPEAAWQQAPWLCSLLIYPRRCCHGRLCRLVPPPQFPESQRTGGQATQMTSTPSPTRTGALLGTPQGLPGRK